MEFKRIAIDTSKAVFTLHGSMSRIGQGIVNLRCRDVSASNFLPKLGASTETFMQDWRCSSHGSYQKSF